MSCKSFRRNILWDLPGHNADTSRAWVKEKSVLAAIPAPDTEHCSFILTNLSLSAGNEPGSLVKPPEIEIGEENEVDRARRLHEFREIFEIRKVPG